VSSKNDRKDRRVLGFLGVGLDNKDGHKRLTRTENFLLVGGSQETHEGMQEIAIKFNEAMDQRGKPLQDASVEEVLDLLNDATESSK
jgi:hypothetical protein